MTSAGSSEAPEVDVLVPLSPMDAILASYGFAVLYVFPSPVEGCSTMDAQKLETSFQALVDEDYRFFIGELQVDAASGRVSVLQTPEARRLGGRGIRFEQAPGHPFTSEEAVESLAWSFMPGKLDTKETIALKCTPLADGGAAIGIALSHTLLDGEGLFTFMRAWGQRYSGVRMEERLVINHDRHLLSGTGRSPRLEHSKAHVAPPSSGETTQLPATTQHAFHVSKANMIELKALARREIEASSSTEAPPFVSTVDIITALFVVLISRARGHGQDVRITTTVNARRRLDPPLPDNYAGNCIFSALSAYTQDELQPETEAGISPGTLTKLARRIRSSILQLDSEFLRDAIDSVAERSDLSRVRLNTKHSLGPDLMFTSWANLGLYDCVFCGTRPCFAGVAKVPFLDGIVVITEAANGDDGLDVLVFLECAAMDKLKHLCAPIPYLAH